MPVISKSKYNDIETRIEKIFTSDMEVKDFTGDVVPTSDDLPDKNKGLIISNCTILFVDIRSSTKLSDKTQAKNMAKIYRAFARAMSMCINESGGRVRQISGDRVMGVFVDDANESSVQKAMVTAQAIQTVIEHLFNPLCRKNVNNKEIGCGIGIDTGRILTSSIGMKHKGEDSRDLVWTGKTANVSSKHTDLAEANEIFVTKRFYDKLPKDFKSDSEGNGIWEKSYRVKGDTIFEGYGVHAYYIDDLIVVDDEDGEERSIPEREKEAGGVDTSGIISDIVQGVEKQLEEVLTRHEKLVLREVSVSASEESIRKKIEELGRREDAVKRKEAILNKKEKDIDKSLKKKERELTYQIKVDSLRERIQQEMKIEDFLSELQELINIGSYLGNKVIDIYEDIYEFLLVDFFVKNEELDMAFGLMIRQLTEKSRNPYIVTSNRAVPIVKKLKKEDVYLEAVLYYIETFNPPLKDRLILKENLKGLGMESKLKYSGALLLE